MSCYRHYRVTVDQNASGNPIVYHRKARKPKTAKGNDRQHNRIVNESVDSWREYGFRRLTVQVVTAEEAAQAWC